MATLDRHVEFNKAAPFKFQEKDKITDPQYHMRPIDEAFFQDRLREWETDVPFFQPWENTDKWFIEWSANTNLGSSVALYRCDNTDMLLPNTGQHTTIAGNLYDGDPMRTEHFVGDFADIPEGFYYMVVTVNFSNDAGDFEDYYISEPLHIAESHPNTVSLNYRNSANDTGTNGFMWFEQFPCFPRFRVPGHLYDLQLKHRKAQYEDEVTEMVLLSGNVYRVWTFASRNIPDWVCDKLNRIFMHDEVYIDTIKVGLDKDAEWQKVKADNYPLYGVSVNLRAQGENGMAEFTKPTPPPPFVCTNNPNFNGMTILPWPDYNILNNNNLGGIDRSIVRIEVDPSTSGLDLASVVYNNWIVSGSDGAWITTGPLAFVANRSYNYYQRGDQSIENGHSTVSCQVTLTDANGCSAITGLVINFGLVYPAGPWGPYESVDYAGQLRNSDFVGFTISNITNNGFDVTVDNPVPTNNYYISLDGGLSLIGYSWDGLTPQTITGLPAATAQNIYVIAGSTHPISAMGPRLETTLP